MTSGPGLRLVNRAHRVLSAPARQRFFHLCVDETWRVQGKWTVDFAGRRLVLTLSRDFPDAWLAAIGFHGYDPEVHALYEALIRSPRPPRVMFDVGASYGLHALRFLVLLREQPPTLQERRWPPAETDSRLLPRRL